jgi:hypothetical protein
MQVFLSVLANCKSVVENNQLVEWYQGFFRSCSTPGMIGTQVRPACNFIYELSNLGLYISYSFLPRTRLRDYRQGLAYLYVQCTYMTPGWASATPAPVSMTRGVSLYESSMSLHGSRVSHDDARVSLDDRARHNFHCPSIKAYSIYHFSHVNWTKGCFSLNLNMGPACWMWILDRTPGVLSS